MATPNMAAPRIGPISARLMPQSSMSAGATKPITAASYPSSIMMMKQSQQHVPLKARDRAGIYPRFHIDNVRVIHRVTSSSRRYECSGWLFLSGTFVLNLRQVTQAVRFENPASDMSFIYNVRDTTKTSQQKTRSQRRRVRARAAFSASE